MSLILKGIDMPTDRKPYGIEVIYRFEGADGLFSEKNYLSPNEAIQIPKDHGNIKDEKEIMKRLEEKEKEPLYQHDTDDWWVGIIDAEDAVNDSPTILEAEE